VQVIAWRTVSESVERDVKPYSLTHSLAYLGMHRKWDIFSGHIMQVNAISPNHCMDGHFTYGTVVVRYYRDPVQCGQLTGSINVVCFFFFPNLDRSDAQMRRKAGTNGRIDDRFVSVPG